MSKRCLFLSLIFVLKGLPPALLISLSRKLTKPILTCVDIAYLQVFKPGLTRQVYFRVYLMGKEY